ncbi:Asp23/Gls24 family envelope stress response protein [Rathayibacter soli]|uniref:DUF6286 domain-containing protein n=1 Tax=Rathayibacter soli TaxID=3144168 RepID=UPI0027E53C64|nr:DUF6286 domain-containing protein [Glaciibacter superstes]
MTTTHSTSARIRRRETHSPRSVAAIIIAIALILTFAWLGLEILLQLLNQPPLLVTPLQMLRATAGITSTPAPWIVAGGIVVAMVGIILVLAAVTGGRRARHVLNTVRSVTVVDDEVIASALARHAASTAGISPDNTEVTISRRHADVRLTPISGVSVDRAAVISAVADELDSYELEPALRDPRLSVESRGKVGA